MSRERAFFDVFPTYTTEDPEIKEMFGYVKIESIECSEERDRIRVSFVSDHLIHKKVILKAERADSPGSEAYRKLASELIERDSITSEYV